MMIRLTRRDFGDLDSALDKEWLETNGLGGYASSTVPGINTRKYHGLLIAALNPPVDRVLLVSRVDEAALIGEARFDLSSSEYEESIHPDGYRNLDEVRLDPYPVFTYIVGGIRLTKSVFMLHGENTTCISYSVEPLPNGPRTSQVVLEIRPLVAFRNHHRVMSEKDEFDSNLDAEPGCVRLRPLLEMPYLYITFGNGRFETSGYWYRNYHYRKEKERGYPCNEDLYSPGRIVLTFEDSRKHYLAFSTHRYTADELVRRAGEETERRQRLVDNPLARHDLGRQLLLAADSFIVERGDKGRTIIAGYPWFTDWGRDSMISLPGLTLATGRAEDAKKIMRTHLRSLDHGLIPNLFPDSGTEAKYNTIDATLWLFEALKKYYDHTGDGDFVASVLPDLRSIIGHHTQRTLYGIKVDEDGLLRGGTEGVQLTWMGSKVGDTVITARIGKPVEVNALWYNALRVMKDLCSEFGGLADESKYAHLARKVFESFNREFWNPDTNCLFDVVTDDSKDDSIRPNQIFALSLTYPVLAVSKWAPVLEVVERELLTPYGLRTLSPNDPAYQGIYKGDLETRDHAYHQGTVWAWLLGHYIRAYIRVHGPAAKTTAYCSRLLEPFIDHLKQAGLGNVSEIFDGDPPHNPRGCIAQAWSVAEILRVLTGDLFDSLGRESLHTHRGSDLLDMGSSL